MNRPRTGRLVAGLLAILAFNAPFLWSDGAYFRKSGSVAVSSDQRAIIIRHDDETSLVLSTAYSGDGADFGWIIPCPVPPAVADVSEADELGEAAFTTLQDHTAPVLVESRGSFMGPPPEADSMSPVTVYGMTTLEHYEVSILGAESAISLLTWLGNNGYVVDSSATSVLEAYIRENRAFVAVRILPGESRV